MHQQASTTPMNSCRSPLMRSEMSVCNPSSLHLLARRTADATLNSKMTYHWCTSALPGAMQGLPKGPKFNLLRQGRVKSIAKESY